METARNKKMFLSPPSSFFLSPMGVKRDRSKYHDGSPALPWTRESPKTELLIYVASMFWKENHSKKLLGQTEKYD